MENSMLIAKILGPYLAIVAIGIIFNLKAYQRMMEDFLKNAALIYLGGAMSLIFGIVIVLFHNVWVAGWPVIITIFGWMGLVKGVWLIVFPNSTGKLTHLYQKKPALLRVHMVIFLIISWLTIYLVQL